MNLIQQMELKKEEFTPNEMLIYNKIMEDPLWVLSQTTSSLAAAANVSQSAVTRFVKNLGYEKYQMFRTDLIACASASQPANPKEEPVHSSYFQNMFDSLSLMQSTFLPERIDQIQSYLFSFRRIYVTGESKSYQPAELLETLSRKYSRRIHAIRQDFLSELCDYLDEEDLIIFFSVSGHSRILDFIPSIQSKIMLVTSNPNPLHKDSFNQIVVIPYAGSNPEAAGVSPVLFDIFVELICQPQKQKEKKEA